MTPGEGGVWRWNKDSGACFEYCGDNGPVVPTPRGPPAPESAEVTAAPPTDGPAEVTSDGPAPPPPGPVEVTTAPRVPPDEMTALPPAEPPGTASGPVGGGDRPMGVGDGTMGGGDGPFGGGERPMGGEPPPIGLTAPPLGPGTAAVDPTLSQGGRRRVRREAAGTASSQVPAYQNTQYQLNRANGFKSRFECENHCSGKYILRTYIRTLSWIR